MQHQLFFNLSVYLINLIKINRNSIKTNRNCQKKSLFAFEKCVNINANDVYLFDIIRRIRVYYLPMFHFVVVVVGCTFCRQAIFSFFLSFLLFKQLAYESWINVVKMCWKPPCNCVFFRMGFPQHDEIYCIFQMQFEFGARFLVNKLEMCKQFGFLCYDFFWFVL